MVTKLSDGQRFYQKTKTKKNSKFDIFKSNYLLTAKVYMNDTYSD